MRRARSIVFTHVPRTAGSSTHYAFLQAAGDTGFVFDTPYRLVPVAQAAGAAHERGELYLGGHFTLADVREHLGIDTADTVNIVVIRDPLERFMSHYALIQTDARAAPAGKVGLHGTSVADFITALESNDQLHMIDNPHCATICGEPRFEAACAALLRDYDLVATLGRIEDLVAATIAACGRTYWPGGPPTLPAARHNAAERARIAAPTAADLARLQPYFAEDAKLYAWLSDRQGLLSIHRR